MIYGTRIWTSILKQEQGEILTDEALTFLAALHRTFDEPRKRLLANRVALQQSIDSGTPLDFAPETALIRVDASWHCAPPAPGLEDRRVEIIGPTDEKSVIKSLYCNANTFVADFEDATSPTFKTLLEGQINLRDAVYLQNNFKLDKTENEPLERTAVIIVRPRGWHRIETRFTVDEEPISSSLFDFGLYFFHNAKELIRRGTGPYFYLSKLEHYTEARLWNEVFTFSQWFLGVPQGTIRATVLIDTLPAVFQMEEMLYELRIHSAGLSCDRLGYVFSFAKRYRADRTAVLPDREDIVRIADLLDPCVRLLIQTCRRRKAAAISEILTPISIRDVNIANSRLLDSARIDTLREVTYGFDGARVVQARLGKLVSQVFTENTTKMNTLRAERRIQPAELRGFPIAGKISANGLRLNAVILFSYVGAWLGGMGRILLDNLLVDATVADAARVHLWQWVYHTVTTEDGNPVTIERVDELLQAIVPDVRKAVPTMSVEHRGIAERYIMHQIRRMWPSEFLASDLMPYLATADGVPEKLCKASL